jgi:hypothetical protein
MPKTDWKIYEIQHRRGPGAPLTTRYQFTVDRDRPAECGISRDRSNIVKDAPGEILRSALADDDVAGNYFLAAEFLYSEPFADAIASVFNAAPRLALTKQTSKPYFSKI